MPDAEQAFAQAVETIDECDVDPLDENGLMNGLHLLDGHPVACRALSFSPMR